MSHNNQINLVPSFYVGTYDKYNRGSLLGKWMKLTDYANIDEFWDACGELHKDERHPEYMLQDYEGCPYGLVDESYIYEELWDLYDELSNEWNAFCAWAEGCGSGLESLTASEIAERFHDSYEGEKDQREIAEEYTDEAFSVIISEIKNPSYDGRRREDIIQLLEAIRDAVDEESLAADVINNYAFNRGYAFRR